MIIQYTELQDEPYGSSFLLQKKDAFRHPYMNILIIASVTAIRQTNKSTSFSPISPLAYKLITCPFFTKAPLGYRLYPVNGFKKQTPALLMLSNKRCVNIPKTKNQNTGLSLTAIQTNGTINHKLCGIHLCGIDIGLNRPMSDSLESISGSKEPST